MTVTVKERKVLKLSGEFLDCQNTMVFFCKINKQTECLLDHLLPKGHSVNWKDFVNVKPAS